jgi:hypothetical protein
MPWSGMLHNHLHPKDAGSQFLQNVMVSVVEEMLKASSSCSYACLLKRLTSELHRCHKCWAYVHPQHGDYLSTLLGWFPPQIKITEE